MKYLFTCILSVAYNCMTYRWKCRRRGGAAGANAPFRPHRSLLVSYFILSETSPNHVAAMFECCPIFLLSFRKTCKCLVVCHINDLKRGAGDRKPWSCVLKLSSFFGRHMIRITGIRNPDAGARSAKYDLYDRVLS